MAKLIIVFILLLLLAFMIAITAQGPGHVPLPALDRHDDTWE